MSQNALPQPPAEDGIQPHYPEQGSYVAPGAHGTLLPAGLDPQHATVLVVHAHPDDESTGTGATMGLLAREGAAVHLLTLTRGEMGEVIGPEHSELDVRNPRRSDDGDGLGALRERELDAACQALGVRGHSYAARGGAPGFFRDSGMSWGPDGRAAADAGAAADCLTRSGIQQVARAVAQSIRSLRPDVVVTYDADGGYGHPDHRRTHEAVLAALDLLTPDERPELVWGLEGDADPEDQRPQAVVHGDGAAKKAAMAAHRTQVRVGEDLTFQYSNGVVQPISAVEAFRLLDGSTESLPGTDGESAAPLAPGPINSALTSVGMGLISGFVGTMYHASITAFTGWFLPWGVILALLLMFSTTLWIASFTQKRWTGPLTGATAFVLVLLFAYLRPHAMLVIPTPQAAIGWVGIVWTLGILVMTWLSVIVAHRTVLRPRRRR